MKKKEKIIVITTSVLIILLVIGCVSIGNFFVDYTIARPAGGYPEDDPLSPQSIESETELTNVAINDINIANLKRDFPPIEETITSIDGLNLCANVYEQNSDNWAILLHGYQSSSKGVEDLAVEYFNRGFNVITPDLRAHGKSDGEYITMGLHDSEDIVLWAEYIVNKNVNSKIVLHGESMGAATVLLASGSPNLPQNVVATIEDSGYTNGYQMMVEQLDYCFGLPQFPVMSLANMMCKVRAGYDMKDVDVLKAIENSTIPILFMHGEQDIFVLPYMQTILYDAYQGPKDIIVFPDADHTASNKLNPDIYYPKVFTFLNEFADFSIEV